MFLSIEIKEIKSGTILKMDKNKCPKSILQKRNLQRPF